VDAQSSIHDALLKQKSMKSKIIIVDDNDEHYVITDSDLRNKVLLGNISIEEKIQKIISSRVISIDKHDFLFNALLMMTQNNIKRLVVKSGEKFVGILEQIDLLSFFANHSHLVAVQIEKAENIEDLKDVQSSLKNLILILKTKGLKGRYITKLVSTLNLKIYKKLFDMCVSKELQEKCALLVMGSEGREEQSVKTDQDNALIIKNGEDVELFVEPMLKLNAYLLEIGFPPCDGNVMVSNEFWRRDVSSYKKLIDSWTQSLDEASVQAFSIFLDSKCVAGDEELLKEL
jgi:CBS domain-containing protein